MKVSINRKLALAILVAVFAVTVSISYVALYHVDTLSRRLRSLYSDAVLPLQAAEKASDEIDAITLNAYRSLAAARDDKPNIVNELRVSQLSLQQHLLHYENDLTITKQPEMQELLFKYGALDEQINSEKTGLKKIHEAFPALQNGIDRVIGDLQIGGNNALAIFISDAAPALREIDANLHIFKALHLKQTEYAEHESQTIRIQARLHVWEVSIAMGLGGICLGIFFVRPISRRIKELGNATVAIAEGNLSHRIEVQSQDELGALAQSFNQMTARMERARKELLGATEIAEAAKEAKSLLLEEMGAIHAKLDAITEAVPDVLYMISPEARMLWWNGNLEAVTCLDHESIARMSASDFVSETDRASMGASIQQAIVTGFSRIDVQLQTKRGPVPYEFNAVPVKDEHGKLLGVAGSGRDISERKQVEERVAASERLLRSILDLLPQRVFWKDKAGRYLGCNQVFLKDTGMSEVIGLTDFDMPWKPEEAVHYRECDARVIARNSPELEIVETLKNALAEEKWLLTNKIPLRDSQGTAIGIIGTYQDITQLKQDEIELIRARDDADAANRAKSEFLANMSHEIRTPLTAILGFADLLREESADAVTPAQRIQAVDTIVNSGQHLLAVINDILDLSKIEADKMTIEKIETNLVGILVEVESFMRSRARGKGVELNMRLGSPVPELMMSDPTRVRQILMNLLGNAIKFTEKGSVTVTTSVFKDGGQPRLVIDVEDTGEGMSEKQIGRLFNTFSQADSTITRKYGGTGLGLTICRRLSNLMDGDVSLIRTESGKGSCFRLKLPLEALAGCKTIASLDTVKIAAKARPATEPVSLSGRILLAEDGPDNQRLIGFHLRRAGASVDIAENGRIALDMLRQAEVHDESYDLLLTDIQMPEMDGYTLTRTLRGRGSTIAVVALTAHVMAEDRDRCIRAGCDDYISKPIDKSVLIEKCASWLRRKSTAKAVTELFAAGLN